MTLIEQLLKSFGTVVQTFGSETIIAAPDVAFLDEWEFSVRNPQSVRMQAIGVAKWITDNHVGSFILRFPSGEEIKFVST